MDYQLIQKNINTLLGYYGKSLSDLALGTGTSERQVIRWVKGAEPTKIPPAKLTRLADYFNISYDDLTTTDIEKAITEDSSTHNRQLKFLDDIIALQMYLDLIGVTAEVQENIERGSIIEYMKFKEVNLTWKDRNGHLKTKTVKYPRFETFARRLKEHVKVEIKYL